MTRLLKDDVQIHLDLILKHGIYSNLIHVVVTVVFVLSIIQYVSMTILVELHRERLRTCAVSYVDQIESITETMQFVVANLSQDNLDEQRSEQSIQLKGPFIFHPASFFRSIMKRAFGSWIVPYISIDLLPRSLIIIVCCFFTAVCLIGITNTPTSAFLLTSCTGTIQLRLLYSLFLRPMTSPCRISSHSMLRKHFNRMQPLPQSL